MGYVEELRAIIGKRRIILCGSAVIIVNHSGDILMQQRTHPVGRWGLPGGLMELGESTVETAQREVYEETNLQVDDLKLLGVYSGENYLCTAANGDEWYVVTTTYVTDTYSGNVSINDDESIQLEWVNPRDLPENTAKTHRIMIHDYLKTV